MPDKMIYVRQADLPVWEQAGKVAPDGNISALVMELMRQAVLDRAEELAKRGEFHQIVIEDGLVEKEFTGRVVAEFERRDADLYGEISEDESYDAVHVYETPRGGIGVWVERFRPYFEGPYLSSTRECEFTSFPSLEALANAVDDGTADDAVKSAWARIPAQRRPRIKVEF